MLLHAQSSSGKKVPVKLVEITEEYLRIAYQGFRPKEKSFPITIQNEYDTTLGNVDIIPQDFGRVLMNLFNNAFYSVYEKSKLIRENPAVTTVAKEAYSPMVTVSIRKMNNGVEVSIKDNGMGILQKNIDKIFQPFFTTKPTGQGTGLGLSISYEIIKAHGGELKVESKEGEGAEFVIQIPVS